MTNDVRADALHTLTTVVCHTAMGLHAAILKDASTSHVQMNLAHPLQQRMRSNEVEVGDGGVVPLGPGRTWSM